MRTTGPMKRKMIEMREQDISIRKIAEHFGVGQGTVQWHTRKPGVLRKTGRKWLMNYRDVYEEFLKGATREELIAKHGIHPETFRRALSEIAKGYGHPSPFPYRRKFDPLEMAYQIITNPTRKMAAEQIGCSEFALYRVMRLKNWPELKGMAIARRNREIRIAYKAGENTTQICLWANVSSQNLNYIVEELPRRTERAPALYLEG